MFRRSVLASIAFVLAGSLAASAGQISLSKDKSVTIAKQGVPGYTPAPPVGTHRAIFSNVGFHYPNGLYFCCYGDTISGPNSQVGQTFWLAAAFTPAADAKVKEIDIGVGWVSGKNDVIVTIYDDAGGVPGNVLDSMHATGLTQFGGCCGLAVFSTRTDGIRVKAGNQYWVSLTTDSSDSTTWAAWNFNSTDQINAVTVAASNGAGWTNLGGSVPAPTFAVLGD